MTAPEQIPQAIPLMPFATPPLPLLVSMLPMLEAISDGVQIFDMVGELVYVNEAAEHNFGYFNANGSAAAGYPGVDDFAQIAFWDEKGYPLPLKQSPYQQVMQGKGFAKQTLTYADRNQCDRCAAIQAFPLCDEAGQALYGVVISQDLTQSYWDSQASQQRTQQIFQITEAVPSLIAYLDRYERHHYANSAYLKVFRTTLPNVVGQPLQTVIGTVFHQQLEEALRQAQQGQLVNLCLPLLEADQKVRYKQVNLIPQQEGNEVVGLYLVINDITAHKHTTDLLQHETNFFRYALEAAKVGIWEWSFISDELMWSPPQEQLFGLIPGSFDGRSDSFLALVDERDRDQLKRAIDQALKPRQIFSVEFRVPLPDNSLRWLSCRGQVLRDGDGLALRMVGVSFDITAQKEAEERLWHQVRRDHLLAQVSQAISRSEDLNEVLPDVVRDVRVYLQVDRIVIIDLRRKTAGKATFEDHVIGVEPMLSWEMRHPWAVKERFLEKYRQGHPVAVHDISTLSLGEAEIGFLEFFQIQADLTIPLLEDQNLWGLLSVHTQTPRRWQSEEQRFLETVGMLISTAVQRDRLHRNLTQANQKLQRFAYLDGLTQVANRRRFEQFMSHEWRRLMREKAPIALIMTDIDHFKAYNDIYGHQMGDECLRRVAGTIRSTVQRPADIVARYGGEEFVVVLPNTDLEGAETVAQKIAAMVRYQKIPHEGSSVSSFVTMSLGVAMMFPHPLKAPDDLVKAADRALYQAKAGGRDRIVCYVPGEANAN